MLIKIIRHHRMPHPFQIGGRGAEHIAQRRQITRHQARILGRSQTKGQIDALADQIHRLVGGNQP